ATGQVVGSNPWHYHLRTRETKRRRSSQAALARATRKINLGDFVRAQRPAVEADLVYFAMVIPAEGRVGVQADQQRLSRGQVARLGRRIESCDHVAISQQLASGG